MNKFTVGLFSAVLSICVGFAELAFSEESANTFRRDNFFIIESSEANGLKGDRKKVKLKLTAGFPDGKGPFPVVVILHGSGNMKGRDVELGKILVENGVAWLGVQTFDSRRLSNTNYFLRLAKANIFDQVNDAYAALNFIEAHPELDASRAALTGFSLGGTSAAVVASGFQEEKAGGLSFKYYLSMYAPCIIENTRRASGVKIDFVWGAEDTSTPKSDCERMKVSFASRGASATSHYLSNTTHGWFSRERTISDSSFQQCRATVDGSTLTIIGSGGGVSLESPTDMFAMRSFGKLCHKKIPYINDANVRAEQFTASLLIKNVKK